MHQAISTPGINLAIHWAGAAITLVLWRRFASTRACGPQDANPLDSQGDVHYWFGKFAEAAASYAAAYAKAPAFLTGGELYKAAWAKFLAGDKAGADASFAKFSEAREEANDQQIDLFTGDWLYRTGRQKEARALLTASAKKAAQAGPPALRAVISDQLALWDALAGNRAAAAKEIAESGTSANTPSYLIIRFAVMPTASVSEWEARAAHLLAAPQLAGLRATAIGNALILDGKKQAEIPVWEEIAKQSPGIDVFPRYMVERLKGQPMEHRSPPDPVNLNEFNALLDQL